MQQKTVKAKWRPDSRRVCSVKCTNCQKRWTATITEDLRIYELECPLCGKIGYAKETGERAR